MSALLDQIKAADRRVVPVPVPRWGVTVYVHRLSLADRLAAAEAIGDLKPADRIAWFVARSVRDADGAPVFGEGDLATLADMDGEAVSEVWRVVKETSKLAQGTDEAAAEKNG
jgi:hypothetical protein